MRSCEAGVRNFGTPFDVFGDGMRCLVFLLCGHRADDSDEEEKSKKKYAVDVFTRRISCIKVFVEYDACTWLSAIGATMRISLFQQLSLFLDIIARSSHMCWSATHSPVGEAPSRPSRQNQVYVTASFSGMTCRWRFYVVGPCRRSIEVLHRFQSVLIGLGSFLPVTLSIYHRVRSPKLPSRPSLHACGRAKLV